MHTTPPRCILALGKIEEGIGKVKQRRLYWVAVVLGGVMGLFLVVWGCVVGISVSFTGSEIQEKITTNLPKINEAVRKKGDYTLDSIAVTVEQDVCAKVALHGTKFRQTFSVEARLCGTPQYRPATGAFYFQPTTTTISPPKFGGGSIEEKARKAAERYVTNQGLQQFVVDSAEKIEGWVTDLVERGVTTALENIPVYHLKHDTKSLVVRAFLDSIEVRGGAVIAHLTLYRLMWWTMLGVLCLLGSIATAFAMLRNPGLGLAITMLDMS